MIIHFGSVIEDFIKGTGFRYTNGNDYISCNHAWYKSVPEGWKPIWPEELPPAIHANYIEQLEKEIEWFKNNPPKNDV